MYLSGKEFSPKFFQCTFAVVNLSCIGFVNPTSCKLNGQNCMSPFAMSGKQ